MSERPRVIFHCGMTKTGSTAIQSSLRTHASELRQDGVVCLVDSSETRLTNEFVSIDHDHRFLEKLHPDSQRISCGSLYYQYRLHRAHVSEVEAANLLGRVSAEIRHEALRSKCVVMSFEGFEASLVMRDQLFKDFVEALTVDFEVELWLYTRPLEQHVLSSWQEFCWHNGMRLSEWTLKYSATCDGTAFWQDLEYSYYGALARYADWIPEWQGREWGLVLRPTSLVGEVSSDFFAGALRVDGISDVAPRANVSWPSNSMRTLPYLSSLFAGDYERFDRIRQVVAGFDAHPGVAEAIRSEALLLVRAHLQNDLAANLRQAERLLELPGGVLGLSGDSDPSPSPLGWDAFRDWEQPRLADWMTLVFALSSGVSAEFQSIQ